MTATIRAAAALFLALAALTGCNTVQGMGEDIQSGGEALTGASEDVQEEITN